MTNEEYYNAIAEFLTSMFEWKNLPEGVNVYTCVKCSDGSVLLLRERSNNDDKR